MFYYRERDYLMMIIRKITLTIALITVATTGNFSVASEADGMIRIKSSHNVSTTLDKLETALTKKGMTIFKRIPHSTGAKKVGLNIRDTELLVFGNPKIGTLLMQCQQTAALDLPMKALAYEDENHQVWLAYNDPAYLAKRHHVKNCNQVINKMTKALANFTKAATQ